MYLLLAVAAAAAVTAAQSPSQPSQTYERNKEYLYEYETQALTGIPQGSTIYSGMKLKCDVRIQFRSRSSATLKLDKIVLAKINDPIESVNPTQQQVPENLFRPLTGKDADQMIKDLSRPINFLYVRGNVREIKQEADDPEWSVNVKKGLLSILEVNLDKRKQLDQSSSIPRVLRPQSSNEDSMYKVMEPSIGGECETLYKVSPHTSSSGDPIMYITKVRNYDNCLDRPMYFSSMFHGKRCAECVKERSDPLRSASQVMYTIRGNTRMFQIQSAISESQHVFTPYSDKGGNVVTYLNQTLNLIKVMDVKESLSQPSSPKTVSSGLQFKSRQIESRDESSSSSKKSPPSSQSPASEVLSKQSQKSADQAKERIRKLLKMLETFMKPTIQEEAGPLLMSLLEEIRKADAESLKAVFRETVQSASADKKKLKMLMDLLPSAGTSPATEVLRDAIKNDQISKPQAAIALNILSLSARPEVLVAKTLLELTQSPKVSQDRMLKRAAFLCLGAVAGKLREEEQRRSRQMVRQENIVNTLMSTVSNSQSRKKLKSKRRDLGDRKRKQQSIYTRIRQEIEIQSLMKSTNMDDKILSFKTAGNSGLREMIPSIRTYIEDKSQPQLLRAQAIYSLRKLTSQHPQDIQSILLPRYFDRTEKEEVRISSYIVLASTSPSRQLLEMVAHSLHRETNPHVGTFVYTHLEQMSNSTYPCLMSWAKNASLALRFAKKFSPMFQYSRFLQYSGYNDRVKLGAAAELGLITSPEEFIPRAGAIHLNTHVLGSSVNFMEIGFNTEGLQTLLSKMVGPLGELTKGKSVVDVLKQRVRRSSQSQQPQSDPISQIHQKLKVSARTSPEPKGHLYIKMMGNELQYLSLDRSTLVETLLKEGKILLSVSEQKMKSGMDMDIHRSLIPLDADTMIPTESGLPLRLRLRGTAAVKVTGKVKVSGVPSLFEINRPGKAARELGLDLEISPSVLVDMRGEMEIDAEYFKAGVSIKSMARAETPLSLSTTFILPSAKVITKVNIEKLNEKVAKMEISPSTYFKENPSDITKYPAPRETQIIRAAKGAKVMPLSISWGKRSLGLEVGMSGQAVLSDFEMNIPYYPMIGKQELFLTLSPGINPQKYMEFQVQLMVPKQQKSAQQPTSDKASNSGEDGIISKLGSYLTLFSGGQSDQIPASSSHSSSPPKDIKSKDSSLSSLLQHLEESQSVQSEKAVVSHNNSVGILMNVIGIDESRSIKRHLQVSMAAGFDMRSRITSILMTLDRSPVPEIETKPWKMDITIKLNLPTRLVNPSELLSKSYQKEVEQQIEVHIRRDGEDEYYRLIDREVPRQQVKVLKTLLSSTSTQEIIDEVVNTEMSQSEESSQSSQTRVIKLIREQKHLLKEVKDIRRRSSDPLKLQRVKSTLSSVLKWSEKVKQILERESSSEPSSEESDILRKYSALLQQIVEQRIEESVLSSMRALSSKDQQSFKKSIETNRESLRKILQRQSSSQRVSQSSQSDPHSPSIPEVQTKDSSQQQTPRKSEESQQRGSSESQPRKSDSQPEVDSKEAKESQQKLKRQQQSTQSQQQEQQSQQSSQRSEQSQESQEQSQRTPQQSQDSASLSQSKSQSPLSKSVSSLLQSQRGAIQELSASKEKAEGAKNIDQKKLETAIRIAKEVNEKIRQEASISSPLSIEKERVKLLKAAVQQQQISKCLEQRIKRQRSKPQTQKEMQETSTLLEQLRRENDKILKVLAIETRHQKERVVARGKHSQREQSVLRSLRRVQLSQVIASQQLVRAGSSSDKPSVDNVQPVQRVQQCMEILDETGKQIVSLVKQRSGKQSPLDVITKLVEVTQMQQSLLGLVAERAREQLIQSVSRSHAVDSRIKRLEEKAETEELEYLQIMKSIRKSIETKRSVSSLSRSDSTKLQAVHNKLELIRSMQIKIERKVKDVDKDQIKSAKKPESTTITELATKCKTVQDEIEKAESDIRSNQLHQKVADTTKEPLRRIEIQKQIVEKVKELVPKSNMSPQEKQTIQADLKTQEKKLEELQKKVQQLKEEESQQRTSSSQGSQSIQSSQSGPTVGIRREDIQQDSEDRQREDSSSNSRKVNVKSEQISQRSQKESAKQWSEKSSDDQQKESKSVQQPRRVDSQQSRDQSLSKEQSSGQKSDRSQSVRQKQKSRSGVKSSALGDLEAETDREMCISIKAKYGAKGEKKKLFEVQILGTPSLEQLLWERAQKSPLERSSVTKKYLREIRDGSEEVTSAYLKLSSEMNMIRHLHVRVHYEREEIPRSLEELAWWSHEAMKAIMYRHLFTKYPHSFRPKDRLEILLNFRRNDRQFDAEFKLPEESNFLRGIAIPYFGPFLFESVKGIRDGVRRPLQKTMSSITSRLPGHCEVKQNRVRTMDGKEYSTPDTKDCEVILSMDCSSAKQFAIKSRKDSSDPTKRVVEVHLEGKRIEIVPVNSSLDVKVDGQNQDVPADSAISIKEASPVSSEASRIEIRRQQNKVSISSSRKGVQVTSDGQKLSIRMTPFYYSQVCGLCGNCDGKQGNDHQSPQRVDRSDPSCLVLDYLIPDSKCDSGSVQKKCNEHQKSSSSSRCQVKPETVLRTRLNKGVSQLCFSQNPVKSCPSQCKQKDPKSKAVPMVCYEHDSVKAQALKKASYKGPVSELKSHQADYSEYVQEPTSCGEI
uniref:Vitellogenin n=1 Tax=Saccostrea glomerata TaxID=157728 RepID=A0A161I6R2_9BIVA|nr:vitellogenin [Saccostrea glomerata]ANB82452.1 vitellogenin [Saccostrea glomerata]